MVLLGVVLRQASAPFGLGPRSRCCSAAARPTAGPVARLRPGRGAVLQGPPVGLLPTVRPRPGYPGRRARRGLGARTRPSPRPRSPAAPTVALHRLDALLLTTLLAVVPRPPRFPAAGAAAAPSRLRGPLFAVMLRPGRRPGPLLANAGPVAAVLVLPAVPCCAAG
ncbi:hypothetical protein ABZW03_18765 [Kitasatospora sp. NPDC004799]|uniref:hypothetical protein n=1 Tax=Kitasatospora sp. NPDC004799 TaxID=3154460 RepID=UPI0033A9ED88